MNEDSTPRKPGAGSARRVLAVAVVALVVAGGFALASRVMEVKPSTPGPEGAAPVAAAAPSATPPQPTIATRTPAAPRPAAPSKPESPEEERARAKRISEQKTFVLKAAREYRQGRLNAFFKPNVFLADFARGGEERIAAVQTLLLDTQPLQALPEGTRFVEQKPEVVLDRMAMIDLLRETARTDPSARDAMVALALAQVDSSLSETAKRGLVGEKYDLFFGLAQVDRQIAVDTYKKLENETLRKLLRPALIAGLSEAGVGATELDQLTRGL